MQKKIDKLRGYMAAGDYAAALRLAAKWPRLGAEREAITQAASALLSPEFYRSMGKCPETIVQAGIAALNRRYGTTQE